MKFLKTLWYWIVYSSVNADKVSLTVKGFLSVAIVALTYYFHITNVPINPDQMTLVVDGIIKVIQALALAATAVVALVGTIRKLYLTGVGKNDVLNTVAPTL